MPISNLIGIEIYHQDIVSANSNCLEAYYEVFKVISVGLNSAFEEVLPVMRDSLTHYLEVTITDVKFVGPMNQEAILFGILLIQFEEIIT